MTAQGDGEQFLVRFNRLKMLAADDPSRLESAWPQSEELQTLCDEIAGLVRSFESIEERSKYAFTHNISSAGALGRRDYDERWRTVVSTIANRELNAWFEEFFPKELRDTEPTAEEIDPLADKIEDWKHEAREDASNIERLPDFASSHHEIDDDAYLDWVPDSLDAWARLEGAGLDVGGALWRRRALPHALVPAHVARHYGVDRASLYRRLHQAGQAFVFGAPLAALALQRAVIEEVLCRHWGAEKGKVREANLPTLDLDARADRLKRLGNDALHGDPERLTADQLDRAIIENFLLLRLLIENAPVDLDRHRQKAP